MKNKPEIARVGQCGSCKFWTPGGSQHATHPGWGSCERTLMSDALFYTLDDNHTPLPMTTQRGFGCADHQLAQSLKGVA